jgi:hypothetical protein
LFLQEKKDYSAEMRWKYGDLLDYLAGLSTYAKLPNMNTTHTRCPVSDRPGIPVEG